MPSPDRLIEIFSTPAGYALQSVGSFACHPGKGGRDASSRVQWFRLPGPGTDSIGCAIAATRMTVGAIIEAAEDRRARQIIPRRT